MSMTCRLKENVYQISFASYTLYIGNIKTTDIKNMTEQILLPCKYAMHF